VVPAEMLSETGNVTVADSLCDPRDRKPGGAEQFGCLFHPQPLQVGLESHAVLLTEKPAEVSRARKCDLACNF